MKEEIIMKLEKEFHRWDKYWLSLNETGKSKTLYANRTNKDELAHLWEWQRMAVARLEAALQNTEPDFSYWPDWVNPLSEDPTHIDNINEWIFKTNKSKSWDELYSLWKENFLKVIELGRKISEAKYQTKGLFPWLGDYTVHDVLLGSYNHYHEEHWPNVEGQK